MTGGVERTCRPIIRGWIVSPALAIALFATPIPPWIVDRFYSRDVYPWLQRLLTEGSNLVPGAVIDIFLVTAAALVLYRVGKLGIALRRRGVIDVLLDGMKRLIRAAAVVALAFMCFWGFNYRRLPLETTLEGGTAATLSEPMLFEAVSDAVALSARLRSRALETMPPTNDALAEILVGPMDAALARLNREPLATPGRPKTSLVLTPYFTAAGVDGMINPLALESIVHADLLPFERPFVLAHEWAHLAGHGDEAEASAVGWFACMNGPPALAYSASLYLMMEGGNQLRGNARSQAFATLDRGVRADLDAIRQRLLRQQPQIRQASSKVYDQYLKANRVEDGTASYSRAVSVILSEPFRGALKDYSADVGRNGRSSRAMPTSESIRKM
jgi:hypothetical protein